MLLASSAPALAREHFQAYEGPARILKGNGGTRINKNGVDFWTMGEPPRRYQVIGLLLDKRNAGKLSGNALGSASVAEEVKRQGGDAVLMGTSETRTTGYIGGVNHFGNFATAYGGAVGETQTSMVVVKYLPDE